MGCDIHWILERRHRDGSWEAVMSDTSEWLRRRNEVQENYDFDEPGTAFGMRSYQYFGALSGVRQNEDGETIATPGLPEDASEHSVKALEWNDPIDLHSHGWLPLGRLRAAASGEFRTPFLEDEEVRGIVGLYLRHLEALLVRNGEAGPTTILRGRAYDHESEVYQPDMTILSNHEKLRLMVRADDFEPLGDETVRLILAYDN